MLTVGSLFAGIGGFDLGLERAGLEVRWQVEIEPFARHILNKHWPDVPCYEDIREVRGEEVERVDVLCGGFPCQDISSAGKGAGIEGARSGLWSEYARLVGEIRPRYVIVENVALLRRRGLDRVLGDLSLLGYDAEWDRIRASDVGAPHQRARLWIVAYPNGEGEHVGPVDAEVGGASTAVGHSQRVDGGSRGSGRPDPAGSRQRESERALLSPDADGQGRPDAQGGAGPTGASGRRVFVSDPHLGGAHHWTVEPAVGRVAHGVPAGMDRVRGLGNALVPQIAEHIGRRIVEYETGVRLAGDTDTQGV